MFGSHSRRIAGASKAPTRIGASGRGRNASPARPARLIDLLVLLSSETGWTAKRLAERYAISERRVFEDLNVLRQAGVRVVSDGNGFRAPDGQFHERLHLGVEDVLQLLRPPDFAAGDVVLARRRLAAAASACK